jgi:hypothetical protein
MMNVRTKPTGVSTRNFNCFGGVPKTYSEYSAELNQEEGLWDGNLNYDANGFPTFTLTFQDPYEDYFKTSRTIVTFKEFAEVPSPTPGATPWARYKVMSDTGNPPFSYVERTQTTGGAMPSTCPSGADVAKVPYTAMYNFYMCNEGAVAPVAPIVPSVPVLPVLSPSPAMVPTAAAPAPAVVAAPVPAPDPVVVPAVAPIASPVIAVTSPSPTPAPPSPTAVEVTSGSYTTSAFVATLATVLFAMLA